MIDLTKEELQALIDFIESDYSGGNEVYDKILKKLKDSL